MLEAMTQIETVPTERKRSGDISVSGASVYDLATSGPYPNFNPSEPAGINNPKTLRDMFPSNMIPVSGQRPVAY